MSEPVSKAEIEDVLSSIRRLVSENANAIRREPEARTMPEKLVLTPAFRIDEEAAEPAEAETDAAPVVETPIAAVETAADPVAAETDAEADPVEAEAEMRELSPLEQRIAELEAVVARSAAEFEPDGSEAEDHLADSFMFHHHVTEQAEPAETHADEAPEAEAEAEQADEVDVAAVAAALAEAVAEEPEAVVADETVEPVEEVASMAAQPAPDDHAFPEPDVAGEAWDSAEAAEAGAGADPLDAVEGDAVEVDELAPVDAWEEVEPSEEDDESGEAVIDEEALREMVARMVREELQGSVGERITHNVRRMVRREIARALSLQDLD